MNHISTIKIYDFNKCVLNDVQLWSDEETPYRPNFTSCSSISWIKYTELPLYLMISLPITIYSNDSVTSDYFKKNLLEVPLSHNRRDLGIICKADTDTYLVFYYHEEAVRMTVITFAKFNKLLPYFNTKLLPVTNTIVDFSKPVRTRTSTVLIDKIIEKKKQRTNPFIANPLILVNNSAKVDNSLILTSKEQINNAINKIILSGLRMRGLSQTLVTSHNDKLAVKEIHQMAFKAAQFALRKHNYSFNKKPGARKPLRLNDLQDIVESLLQVFVDIE